MKRNDSYLKILHARLLDFASEQDRERLREITDLLRSGIRHPLEVADSGLFTDTHPIRLEALTVFDAFEAVTNGMENPEAMERLSALPETSLFSPWKPLIRAIAAFYRNEPGSREANLSLIPAESIPGLLVPLLSVLPDSGPENTRSEAEQELTTAVTDDDPLLRSGLLQLKDALDEKLEGLFVETAALLYRELAPRQQTTADRLLLWCFRSLRSSDLPVSSLSNRIHSMLPACRLHRLEALAAMDSNPAEALLSWERSLLAGLREEAPSRMEIRQYLAILLDLLDAAEDQGAFPSEEEMAGSGLRKVTEELSSELAFRFTLPSNALPPAGRPRALLRAIASSVAVSAEEKPEPSETPELQATAESTSPDERSIPEPVNGKTGTRKGRKRTVRDPGAGHRGASPVPARQLELFSLADAH